MLNNADFLYYVSANAIWSTGDISLIDAEFISSDESILSVDGNTVNGITEGKCQLYAKYKQFKDYINVIVSKSSDDNNSSYVENVYDIKKDIDIAITDGKISVNSEYENPIIKVCIYDIYGRCVYSSKEEKDSNGIAIFELPKMTSNIYIIKVESGNVHKSFKYLVEY